MSPAGLARTTSRGLAAAVEVVVYQHLMHRAAWDLELPRELIESPTLFATWRRLAQE